MELWTSWLVTFVCLLITFWFYNKRNKRESREDDPLAIEPCPNPNCIRCRKYAQVNATAQERLISMVNPPERLVSAVQVGRRGTRRLNVNTSPRTGQYPTVLLLPGLTARPIVTDMHRSCCEVIKSHTSTILQEYLEANEYASWLENDVARENDSSTWNVLHLMNQGVWNEENAALCPETTKAVRLLELMEDCIFGNVFLSVLTPGTSIEPHCGPTNARHRLHLALQIPSGGEQGPCLIVLEQLVTWKEGEAFVFDDSLTHAVEYPEAATTPSVSTAIPRVVLIVDLWHPDLTIRERRAIQELYPTVQ